MSDEFVFDPDSAQVLGEAKQIHLHVDQSSVKLVRNAKGDTQVEIKVVAGTTPEQMAAIRALAYANYKLTVEQTGGLLPAVTT